MKNKKQKDKKAKLANQPFINGGILCNSFESTESGQINGLGVFVAFNSWGYPCLRQWILLTRAFYLPAEKLTVKILLNKVGQKKEVKLIEYPIEISEKISSRVLKIPLQYRFIKPGDYNLIVSLKEYPSTMKITIPVVTQQWPEFTNEERQFVKTNPQFIQAFRATVQCEECNSPYIFEEVVIDFPPMANIHHFPKNGVFHCHKCRHKIYLKDIQGQFRASLKSNLLKAMSSS